MAITGKEIAKKLGLSQTAVSMALNDRPGVSDETRRLVLETAERGGYDFGRLGDKHIRKGSIYFIGSQTSSAIFSYTPIFDEILEGALFECQASNVRLKVQQFYGNRNALRDQIADLRVADCIGIILLGTETKADILQDFLALRVPIIVVDSYIEMPNLTCVLINNEQGAYQATEHLIKRRLVQPGYLRSLVPLRNFDERRSGFERALRDNGMSPSGSIVHELPPTIDGAMAEMLDVIDHSTKLANCYFADNDLIAIGAMKALQQRGYRIPEDVAIVGFDNISEGRVTDPGLTTINIPRTFMGRLAARLLIRHLDEPMAHSIKVEVSTELVKRGSA